MRIDYRKQFLTALDGVESDAARQLREFAAGDPMPCWGGLYRKFGELFSKERDLRTAFDRFCKTPDCDRFLLLMLHLGRDDSTVVEIFLEGFERLPSSVQAYFLCLPEGAEAVKAADKKVSPIVADLLEDQLQRARERQMLIAKINKLLRYEWAPTEESHERRSAGGKPAPAVSTQADIPPNNKEAT